MNNSSNTHRSLRQIAVIRAWFDEVDGKPTRRTLHADVTFREERLGGGPDSNVVFKVALKRCEVVAVLPGGGQSISPDPRTIRATPPKKARTKERTKKSSQGGGWGGKLSLRRKPDAELTARYERSQDQAVAETDTQTVDYFDTLHGQSKEGFPSWRILAYDDHLDGTLWDANTEPLFVIVDKRPEGVIEKENNRSISPSATLQVRCFREDLDVYDIKFKDEEENSIFSGKKGKQNRLRAAEAYLKRELLSEGLVFGDLSDVYSELLLADRVVPLYESLYE